MVIKKATLEEAETAAVLAIQMWAEHTTDELRQDFQEYIGAQMRILQVDDFVSVNC